MRLALFCNPPRTAAERLYTRRTQIAVAACLGLFIALSQTGERLPVGPLHTTLVGLSGVFFLGEVIAVALLLYRRFDEFQRVLLIRSFLWANVLTVGLATVWGFVEISGRGGVPHVPFLMLPATLIILTAVIKVLIFRRNRISPE